MEQVRAAVVHDDADAQVVEDGAVGVAEEAACRAHDRGRELDAVDRRDVGVGRDRRERHPGPEADHEGVAWRGVEQRRKVPEEAGVAAAGQRVGDHRRGADLQLPAPLAAGLDLEDRDGAADVLLRVEQAAARALLRPRDEGSRRPGPRHQRAPRRRRPRRRRARPAAWSSRGGRRRPRARARRTTRGSPAPRRQAATRSRTGGRPDRAAERVQGHRGAQAASDLGGVARERAAGERERAPHEERRPEHEQRALEERDHEPEGGVAAHRGGQVPTRNRAASSLRGLATTQSPALASRVDSRTSAVVTA